MARRIKRRNGLTRQDKTAPKFPDLLRRDFTAPAPNQVWVGDMVRHEALCIREVVQGHLCWPAAAGR